MLELLKIQRFSLFGGPDSIVHRIRNFTTKNKSQDEMGSPRGVTYDSICGGYSHISSPGCNSLLNLVFLS